jgi:hypothetical protein
VLKCTVDHILQEFYTPFLTRFRTYKIASPPLTKMTSKDDIKGLVSLKFLRPCLAPMVGPALDLPVGDVFLLKRAQRDVQDGVCQRFVGGLLHQDREVRDDPGCSVGNLYRRCAQSQIGFRHFVYLKNALIRTAL